MKYKSTRMMATNNQLWRIAIQDPSIPECIQIGLKIKNITQSEFAQVCGCSPSRISAIVNRKCSDPCPQHIWEKAVALGVIAAPYVTPDQVLSTVNLRCPICHKSQIVDLEEFAECCRSGSFPYYCNNDNSPLEPIRFAPSPHRKDDNKVVARCLWEQKVRKEGLKIIPLRLGLTYVPCFLVRGDKITYIEPHEIGSITYKGEVVDVHWEEREILVRILEKEGYGTGGISKTAYPILRYPPKEDLRVKRRQKKAD